MGEPAHQERNQADEGQGSEGLLFDQSADSCDSRTRLIGRIAVSVLNFLGGLAGFAFDLCRGVADQRTSGVLHLTGGILECTFSVFFTHCSLLSWRDHSSLRRKSA
jgi:hypothetical protein